MEIHGISWDLVGEVVVGYVIIPNQVGCQNPPKIHPIIFP
jgi:hypothetical protein